MMIKRLSHLFQKILSIAREERDLPWNTGGTYGPYGRRPHTMHTVDHTVRPSI